MAEPLSVTTPVYGELFGPEVVSRMSTRDLAFTMHLADDRLAAVLAGELVKRVWPDDLQSITCMDLIAALANMPGDGLPRGIPRAP